MPQGPARMLKSRARVPASEGPPSAPVGFLVSAIRQGVTGTKRSPVETGVAYWVNLKRCPPMLMLATRGVGLGLAANEYPTVPFPLPGDPKVTVSQLAVLVAVQEHPPMTFTWIVPLPAISAQKSPGGLKP